MDSEETREVKKPRRSNQWNASHRPSIKNMTQCQDLSVEHTSSAVSKRARACIVSWPTSASYSANSTDHEQGIVKVSDKMHEMGEWEPKRIHYDCHSAELLDDDLYSQGRDDEVRAMEDYGVPKEIDITDAVGGTKTPDDSLSPT